MSTDRGGPTTGAELHERLQELLRQARDNGVDVRGGWTCHNGSGRPDWDTVITEVKTRDSPHGTAGRQAPADRDTMTEDQFRTVLAAQPWRILTALERKSPLAAEPVLNADERLDGESRVTLIQELHGAVLPQLAADGTVEFDRESESLRRGPQFDTLGPLLERPPEELRGLTAGPFVYDEKREIVRYDPDRSLEGEDGQTGHDG